ncbi:ATP dependent DNA ligase domain-containing protein 2 [Elsinoe fawcettii]|nr:ATP dependent DNA ligase domain-containing protein 2 [Elsinoe fawcettii]
MSTPNKRRKKNDYAASNQPVKSLDFFFGRQKDTKPVTAAPVERTAVKQDESGTLTDEEYARKLQAQWAEEDRQQTNEVVNGSGPEELKSVLQDNEDDLYTNSFKATGKSEAIEQNGVIQQEPDLNEGEVSKPDPDPPPAPKNAFASLGKNTLSLQSATAEDDEVSNTVPFDQSPFTFEPQQYITDLKKEWVKEGGKATYSILTRSFVLINSTQSRIKIVDTLVNLIRTIIEGDPDSLLPAVWLATNSISPPYIDVELGLGGSAISKALKKVCGLDNAGLKTLYNKYGDAGDVAFEAKKRQSLTLRKPKPLTIKSVFESLHKIANAKGQGCQDVKQRIVERLVQDARGAEESRYIVRTLVQHLRIGAVKTTMLIALSRAFMLSRPPGAEFEIKDKAQLAKLSKQDLAEVWSKGEELVKACFARRPNYNDLVPTLLEVGSTSNELLVRCGLSMHIPLRPMLGGITRDMGEMLTKLQGRDFSCEYKYDGQRAQVHCDAKGKVTIFSRHLEVMTDKYPDLVALVPKIRGEGVSSFIMEGEVVAVDRESGELKPFQILANRARKDVVVQSVKIDVCLFSFDLMYLNGEELLDRPFRERRSLLRSMFVEIPNHFTWVKSLDATSADVEAVSDFFKSALDIKCEGIMVKVLDNLPNPDLLATLDDDTAAAISAAAPNIDPSRTTPPPTTTDSPITPSKRATSSVPPTPSKKKSKKQSTKPSDPDVPEEKKGGRRKALLSTYEPDKRLDSWLKVKKDYSTTSDTIDLIPIGGWHGQGRKSAWWSPILMAARDPETGSLYAVTKCMSGFTDAFYKANKEKYAEGGDNTLREKPSYVEYVGQPAVWFEPQEVWEMAFADVTISPTYTAAIGLVNEEKGLSLRFPRFLKAREDKSIDEASTVDFLAGLYRKQEARAPEREVKVEEEEE